jgi:hypothetical protein
MVGPIMKARKAMSHYRFSDMDLYGDSVALKNTDGRKVVVSADQEVYHRGKGKFGIYEELRDAHRKSKGYNPRVPRGKIGDGKNRHKSDKRKKK